MTRVHKGDAVTVSGITRSVKRIRTAAQERQVQTPTIFGRRLPLGGVQSAGVERGSVAVTSATLASYGQTGNPVILVSPLRNLPIQARARRISADEPIGSLNPKKPDPITGYGLFPSALRLAPDSVAAHGSLKCFLPLRGRGSRRFHENVSNDIEKRIGINRPTHRRIHCCDLVARHPSLHTNLQNVDRLCKGVFLRQGIILNHSR